MGHIHQQEKLIFMVYNKKIGNTTNGYLLTTGANKEIERYHILNLNNDSKYINFKRKLVKILK